MATQEIIQIYRGDSFSGTINLRSVDPCSGIENLYPVGVSDTIEIHFPASDPLSPVVLSTANPGEITLVNTTLSTIGYQGDPTKSLAMALSTLKAPATLTLIHTTVAGVVTTFQQAKVLVILDRANP